MLLQSLSSRKILVDLGPNQLFGLVVLLIWTIGIGTGIGVRLESRAGKTDTKWWAFWISAREEMGERVDKKTLHLRANMK